MRDFDPVESTATNREFEGHFTHWRYSQNPAFGRVDEEQETHGECALADFCTLTHVSCDQGIYSISLTVPTDDTDLHARCNSDGQP